MLYARVLEKQVISRACHCLTFALCESYQGTGMFFPFQMTQLTAYLSVFWQYWQRVQHLCQQLSLGFSCILAWHCQQPVVASECPLLHACKATARVITTTPRKVSVVALSLRRLNSSALFPSSHRNWCQFPGRAKQFPSSLYSNTHTRPRLHRYGRLETHIPTLVKYHIDSLTDWVIYILREWIGPDRFKHVAIAAHRERSCPLQALINKLFASSVCGRRTFRHESRSDFVKTLNFPLLDTEGGDDWFRVGKFLPRSASHTWLAMHKIWKQMPVPFHAQ